MPVIQLEAKIVCDPESAPEDLDIGLEQTAFHHCRMAEFHSRQAEKFYRLAEQHRTAELLK